MAVKIRLTRMGAKNRPFFRIVVTDSRNPRDGKYIESIGYFDPVADPLVLKIDEEKLALWVKRGAQLTDRVKSLVKRAGIDLSKLKS